MNQPPRRTSWSGRERQYPWFRVYNTFPGHRKWRFLSRELNIHIAFVETTIMDLLAHANRNDAGKARGSLEGWSPAICAATHDLDAEHCARIYSKLEEIGDIDQDYLVNWDKRQPDRHDPTAAARQARARERKKARLLAQPQPTAAALAEPAAATRPPDPRDDQISSHYWLHTDGEKVVASRLGVRALNAKVVISGWLKECLKDAKALEAIILAAHQENLSGDAFRNVVGQKVAQLKQERTVGRQLPFPPTLAVSK